MRKNNFRWIAAIVAVFGLVVIVRLKRKKAGD